VEEVLLVRRVLVQKRCVLAPQEQVRRRVRV
jgi:hypothetical protein